MANNLTVPLILMRLLPMALLCKLPFFLAKVQSRQIVSCLLMLPLFPWVSKLLEES